MSQARFEMLLADALFAADPLAAVRRAARDRTLPAEVRAALRAIDADGLELAVLLVARLRFERLLHGSPEAEAWFDSGPEAFTAAFRRYHREVPATAFFPPEEAALWSRWRKR